MKEYREIYPKELFELIVKYAERYSEITNLPLLEVIRDVTPIYFFIGNYSWDYNPKSDYWGEYVQRIANGEKADTLAYLMHLKNNKRLSKESEWFGCFRYKYVEDTKTIKIHFRNYDHSGMGPLSINNKQIRLEELKRMFIEIKMQHPETRYVQGSSWLYNYESYRRLFPNTYTRNMQSVLPKTQYMVIWGQFLNSEWVVIKEMKDMFLEKIAIASSIDELHLSFKYQNKTPRGDITDFYSLYNIVQTSSPV